MAGLLRENYITHAQTVSRLVCDVIGDFPAVPLGVCHVNMFDGNFAT